MKSNSTFSVVLKCKARSSPVYANRKWMKGGLIFIGRPLQKKKAAYILYIKYVYTVEGEKHGD